MLRGLAQRKSAVRAVPARRPLPHRRTPHPRVCHAVPPAIMTNRCVQKEEGLELVPGLVLKKVGPHSLAVDGRRRLCAQLGYNVHLLAPPAAQLPSGALSRRACSHQFARVV